MSLNTHFGFLNGYGFWITSKLEVFKVGFDESRTNKIPDDSIILLANVNIRASGFIVRNVKLQQYIESKDPQLKEYSFITVLIETDKGCIEMKYDEGYKGERALSNWAHFLSHYVGYASLIDRAMVELKDILK